MSRRDSARRAVAAAVAGVLALAGAVVPTLPASAAADGIEFSANGTDWASTPPAALFPRGFMLAPLGTETAQLWVRHTHAAGAQFLAVVRDITASDPGLMADVTFAARDDSGAGIGPVPLGSIAQCTAIVPTRDLAADAPLHLTIDVSLSPGASGDELQNQALNFSLAFGATDVGVPAPADGCPAQSSTVPGGGGGGGGTGGTLSSTGNPPVLLPAGLVLVVTGLLVLLLVRRRRGEGEGAE